MVNELPKLDSARSEAGRQKSTNLQSKEGLWSRLRSGLEARNRFVESQVSKNLAFQIRALRDREGWSQEELSKKVGMTQNAISRLENPFYGKPTITTLKRIATAFDVALVVRFVPFSHLVNWVSGTPVTDTGLSMDQLSVPSFAEENLTIEPTLGTISVRNARDSINVAAQTNTFSSGAVSNILPDSGRPSEEAWLGAIPSQAA